MKQVCSHVNHTEFKDGELYFESGISYKDKICLKCSLPAGRILVRKKDRFILL